MNPINYLHEIAYPDLSREIFEKQLEQVPDLLRQIEKALASGTFFLPSDKEAELKEDLQFIKFRIKRTCISPKQQQIAADIDRIFAQDKRSLCIEQIFSLLNGSDRSSIDALWKSGHITVSGHKGVLSFSNALYKKLNRDLLIFILEHSDEENLKKICSITTREYAWCEPDGPELFLKYCPNLALSSFCELPSSFCCHSLDTEEGEVIVNKAIFSRATKVALWRKGMIEADMDSIPIKDTNHEMLQHSWDLVLGRTWNIPKLDLNKIVGLYYTLDKFLLFDTKEVHDRFDALAIEVIDTYTNQFDEVSAPELLRELGVLFTHGRCPKLQSNMAARCLHLATSPQLTIEQATPFVLWALPAVERALAFALIEACGTQTFVGPREKKEFYKNTIQQLEKKELDPFIFYRDFSSGEDRFHPEVSSRAKEVYHPFLSFQEKLSWAIDSDNNDLFKTLEPFLCRDAAFGVKEKLISRLQKEIIKRVRSNGNWNELLELPFVREHIVEICGSTHDIWYYIHIDFEESSIKNLARYLKVVLELSPPQPQQDELKLLLGRLLQALPEGVAREQAKQLFSEVMQFGDSEQVKTRALFFLVNLLHIQGATVEARALLVEHTFLEQSDCDVRDLFLALFDKKDAIAPLNATRYYSYANDRVWELRRLLNTSGTEYAITQFSSFFRELLRLKPEELIQDPSFRLL